jgi:hypothetical protein
MPDKRRMPTPTIVPKTSARPKVSPNMRRKGCEFVVLIPGQKGSGIYAFARVHLESRRNPALRPKP